MRAALAALLLSSGLALGAGPPFWRFPPSNCSTPSATCLFANPTVTGALTLTGTSTPQISSTGAATLELRSGATGSTTGFRLAVNANTSGNLLMVTEKVSGVDEERLTLDQFDLNLVGMGLNLTNAVTQLSGGGDAPIVTKGGVVSTGNTSRVFSAQDGFANRKLDVWGSSGGMTVPGAATGSQFTCNGSSVTRLNYDTTLNAWVFCDGTAMQTLPYVLTFNGSQDVGSVPAFSCSVFTIAATGVVDADVAFCDSPGSLDINLTASCETGVDVIGWKVCNHTALAIDPASGAYNARVLRP